MKKASIKVFIVIFIVSFFFPLFSKPTLSANLTGLSDTMSRLKEGIASDHEIKFTSPTGAGDNTDTIEITFDAGFTVGSVDYTDIDLSHGASTGFETEETLADTAGVSSWGASFTGQVLTLTHPTNGANGDIAASDIVVVQIGQNATGGILNAQLTNPGSDGSKTISIAGTFGDIGSLAVAIMTEDQITVTATVNPTISSALLDGSNNPIATCALGTLSQAAINVCTYKNRVNTNATGGYTSTIMANGQLGSGTHNIPDENTTQIDRGTEEYGIGTNSPDLNLDLPTYTTCQDGATQIAGPVSTIALKYADYGSPANNRDTSLCHAVSISGITPAGNYSQVVTHITTGHF